MCLECERSHKNPRSMYRTIKTSLIDCYSNVCIEVLLQPGVGTVTGDLSASHVRRQKERSLEWRVYEDTLLGKTTTTE